MQKNRGNFKTPFDLYASMLSDLWVETQQLKVIRETRKRREYARQYYQRRKAQQKDRELAKWIEFKRAQFAAEASEQSEVQP